MPRRVLLGLATMVLASAFSTARAEDAPLFDIPRLDNISVDGDPSDWGARGFCVPMLGGGMGRFRAAGDLDASFRLGWDERGLLVLVEVADNDYVEAPDPKDAWQKDSVELFVAARRGVSDLCQVVISPGMDPKHPEVRTCVYDFRAALKSGHPPVVTAARKKQGNRYSLEVLLPWSNLDIKPELGREIALQAYVNDADSYEDSGLDAYHAIWFPITGADTAPNRMYRIRLAQEPSTAPTVVTAGQQRGQLPRVRVAAGVQRAGETVVVRQGARTLATGNLVAEGVRATAELKLPYPEMGKSIPRSEPPSGTEGGVTVSLNGRPVGEATIRPARLPQLRADVIGSSESGKATTLRVDFNPPGDDFPRVRARVEVFDLTGERVAHDSCRLKEQVAFKLPAGLYRTRLRVSDFFGREIVSEGAFFVGDERRGTVQGVADAARALASDPQAKDHAGSLRWMAAQVEADLAKKEVPWPETVALAGRLAGYARLVAQGRNPVAELRGMQDLAYESAVDGSDQPFRIDIPDSYDPKRPCALLVFLHGSGGDYKAFSNGAGALAEAECPFITLGVMGRARAAGYGCLSEVDVLEAMEHVKRLWNIDPDRVHLGGFSMGGGGAYAIPSRHPDLFASAIPMAGYGLSSRVENMLNLPVCAVHGDEDNRVVISDSRAAIRRLAELGGEAVLIEGKGYGHSIWLGADAMDRVAAWIEGHTRPKALRHVRYTATDESAREAYWVKVAEWGSEGRPASVDAQIGTDNTLYVTLDNVRSARIMLLTSPADGMQPMMVVVNQKVQTTVPSPLPAAIYITREKDGWEISDRVPDPPAERLHFPGGAQALFHGEPLMIVWGTQGPEALRKKMYDAAQAARKSPGPNWRDAMLYGRLPGKPDSEVTPEDMAAYNLVLIGTAEQNSVVAKIASELPVRLKNGRAVSDDGFSWNMKDRALGLLYFNPRAKDRLIYWAASESSEFYKPGTPLMGRQSWQAGPDFIIAHASDQQQVAARRFDSRWRWEEGYGRSPLVDQAHATQEGAEDAFGEAIRRAAAADLVLVEAGERPDRLVSAPGETRKIDITAWEYDGLLAVMDLSGREILESVALFKNMKRDAGRVMGVPAAGLQSDRIYRVALASWMIGAYAHATGRNPMSFRLLEIPLRDALQRHLEVGKAQ